MGLMFIFPVSEDEKDRVSLKDKEITLKTYGLPMIFWGYLAAALAVLFAMIIGIKNPMIKLYNTNDSFNQALVIMVLATMIITPLVFIAFYFYEKFITKKGDQITLTHRLFWLPVRKKRLSLKSNDSFKIKHYMDSPNVAKLNGNKDMRGFENKGYFELFIIDKNDKEILIDRSSRKADLKKMIDLLSNY